MCGPQVSDLEGAEGKKKSDVEKSCQLRLYSPAAFYLSVHVTVREEIKSLHGQGPEDHIARKAMTNKAICFYFLGITSRKR